MRAPVNINTKHKQELKMLFHKRGYSGQFMGNISRGWTIQDTTAVAK